VKQEAKETASASDEQCRKFEQAARELGTDDDPERFKERVWKIGSVKPAINSDKSKRAQADD
jgi:hypothetical protein